MSAAEQSRLEAERKYQEALARLTQLSAARQRYTDQMYQQANAQLAAQEETANADWSDDLLKGAASGAMVGGLGGWAGAGIGAGIGALLGGGLGAYKSYKYYKDKGYKDPWSRAFTFDGGSMSPDVLMDSFGMAGTGIARAQANQPVEMGGGGGNKYNTHKDIERAYGRLPTAAELGPFGAGAPPPPPIAPMGPSIGGYRSTTRPGMAW